MHCIFMPTELRIKRALTCECNRNDSGQYEPRCLMHFVVSFSGCWEQTDSLHRKALLYTNTYAHHARATTNSTTPEVILSDTLWLDTLPQSNKNPRKSEVNYKGKFEQSYSLI